MPNSGREHIEQKENAPAVFKSAGALVYLPVLLLMTILAKSFLALVGSHLMAFALLSAWHNGVPLNCELLALSLLLVVSRSRCA